MQTFLDLLVAQVRAVDSLLCVGLDPRARDVAALRDECLRLIEATAEFAAAFKPNSAFFEVFGAEGFAALGEVIAHIPPGIPVILDAKRADIPDTSEAYARAAFDLLGAHAITVNPYLGGDALAPFFARPGRGAFVLCKTSNPGAGEFQSQTTGDRMLYQVVAEHARAWNTHGNVGLVVGATDPDALKRLRALAPELWFLVPGIGRQGGDLEAALEAGLQPDGLGLLINVSRTIADAPDPREQARRLRDEINRLRALFSASPSPAAPSPQPELSGLARSLIESGCVRFGEFKLKSGIDSPIYLDLRRLVSHPVALRLAASAYAALLSRLQFDRLAGIPYAALPIATAIALEMDRPLIYPRRETKEYGTRAAIEGDYVAGETVVVIDDLATTGLTKVEAIQKLEGAGLKVRDIVVLIDREQGARAALAQAGYNLHPVVTLRGLLEEWQRQGSISSAEYVRVAAFLEGR